MTTFHGLGLRILREHPEAAGLPPSFGVADEAALVRVAAELTGSERDGRKLAADPQGRGVARRADRARPGGLRRPDRAAGGAAGS